MPYDPLPRRLARRRALLLAPALLALLAPAARGAADTLTAQEERGRQIYRQGTSPKGEIVAVMGEDQIEVPAATVPCASCHGVDGRGRPEGGVVPSDLTWDALTRPASRPGGRSRPPYDERRFTRAVTLGLDPAGQTLNAAMPRFRLSLEDMAALLAYVKRLGREGEPGVTDAAVRLGVVLPPAGVLIGMGRAVRAAVEARCDEWNRAGGFYGRRIEPRFLVPPGEATQRHRAIGAFLTGEEPAFAALGAFFASAESDADLFAANEVPLVGPFTLHPQESLPLNRYVFYLSPGLEAQGAALLRFVRGLPGELHPVVVAPDDDSFEPALGVIERAAATWAPVARLRYAPRAFAPAALAHRLAGGRADPVFFLGSGAEALALLREADALGWHPRLLATGAAGDGSLLGAPAAFAGRIFLALPSLPAPAPEAARRYAQLAADHALPREDVSAQLTVLAAAEVLGEALRRTGRELTRERLIAQLESLRGFTTGYTPPVTFGPARRLGAHGAYVVPVDLAAHGYGAAQWMEGE